MYREKLFHGSNRVRGEKALRTQRLPITEGERHWLGDGHYFFKEDFDSYKWIVDMFNKRCHTLTLNYANLIKYYLILESDIQTYEIRVLDLTTSRYKILYDKVYEELVFKKQEKISEGVVINYMFNELPDYKTEFDLVKAMFTLNSKQYDGMETRIGYIPQVQVCIKNENIIQSISELNFNDKNSEYENLLNNYHFGSRNLRSSTYSKDRTYKYLK